MKIVPFEAKHLLDVDLQDSQAYLSKWITMEQAKAIEATEWAFTGVNEDGSLMGCAGLISMWNGRAMAWAYISKSAEGRNFVQSSHKLCLGSLRHVILSALKSLSIVILNKAIGGLKCWVLRWKLNV
jgi:hypothetical protein